MLEVSAACGTEDNNERTNVDCYDETKLTRLAIQLVHPAVFLTTSNVTLSPNIVQM